MLFIIVVVVKCVKYTFASERSIHPSIQRSFILSSSSFFASHLIQRLFAVFSTISLSLSLSLALVKTTFHQNNEIGYYLVDDIINAVVVLLLLFFYFLGAMWACVCVYAQIFSIPEHTVLKLCRGMRFARYRRKLM